VSLRCSFRAPGLTVVVILVPAPVMIIAVARVTVVIVAVPPRGTSIRMIEASTPARVLVAIRAPPATEPILIAIPATPATEPVLVVVALTPAPQPILVLATPATEPILVAVPITPTPKPLLIPITPVNSTFFEAHHCYPGRVFAKFSLLSGIKAVVERFLGARYARQCCTQIAQRLSPLSYRLDRIGCFY
jgi:hypothetical protein